MADRTVLVVIPLPAQGHAPVLIHFARKLAVQGFSIVLVNVDSVHEKIAARWKSSGSIQLESIPLSYSIPARIDDQAFSRQEELRKALLGLQVPLEELLVSRVIGEQGLRIKCIISDFHAVWTTPVAQKLGIPQVCFWSGSAAWALIDHHIPLLDTLGYIPVPDEEQNVISFIPGMDPFPASDLPYFLHEFSRVSMSNLLAKSRRVKTDKWFLANTSEALEPRETEAMKKFLGEKFLSIGPLLSLNDEECQQVVSLEQEQRHCLEWLDSRPVKSVLYISFGSLAVISSEQLKELAMGVETSGVSFLWVIRPAFLPREDPAMMDFFQMFRDKVAVDENAMIVSWTPQQRVLSHKSIGAFLSHCGWNSILESIWNAVPVLGWPCHSEQNLNCRLLVEGRGVGSRIAARSRTGVVSRDEVSEAVRKSMEDGFEAREVVFGLRNSAVASVLEGGSSWRDMDTFVRSLKTM